MSRPGCSQSRPPCRSLQAELAADGRVVEVYAASTQAQQRRQIRPSDGSERGEQAKRGQRPQVRGTRLCYCAVSGCVMYGEREVGTL